MVSLLTENIILVSVRNIMAENETFFANSGVSLVPIMVLFIEKVMVRAGTKSNLYLQDLKTLSNFYLFYQCYRCPSLRCCLPWLWSKTISSKNWLTVNLYHVACNDRHNEPTSPNPLLITSTPRRYFDLKKAITTLGITGDGFFHSWSWVKLMPSPPSHFGPSIFMMELYSKIFTVRKSLVASLTLRKWS